MISPKTEARLATAAAREGSYQPNQQTAAKLSDKTLVMFVGPVASGKSFLMNHLAQANNHFGRVSVFTTRDPRADDEPGMFRCQPHDDEHLDQLLTMIEHGDVVQYAVHPTSGRLYGSLPTDYPSSINMLATLSGIVDNMRRLPFAHVHVVGLAVDPNVWLQRLHDRYPTTSPERTKRLQEAIQSLEWLLSPERNNEVIWVDNTPTDAAPAVRTISNAITQSTQGDGAAKQFAMSTLRHLYEEQL